MKVARRSDRNDLAKPESERTSYPDEPLRNVESLLLGRIGQLLGPIREDRRRAKTAAELEAGVVPMDLDTVADASR